MPTAEAAGQQRELVLFRLGDGWFAADIHSAREIVPFEGVTRLPSLAAWAMGVMRIRGEVVPVADLSARLNNDAAGSASDRAGDRVIVVEVGDEVVGVLVDAVSDVLRVPSSQVKPPPPLLAAGSYVEGVIQVDDRLVMLIDVGMLFDGSVERDVEAPSAERRLELVEAGDETVVAPTQRDDAWLSLVKQGTANAMVGLSQMIGREAELHELRLRHVAAEDLTASLSPDEQAVAIHLGVSGAATGDIVLIYEPDIACSFADLLMWQPVGTTSDLGEIERSALSEMGNVLSGFFLNALADATGLNLMPSPPTMVVGAPEELAEILSRTRPSGEHTYISEAVYGVDGREIAGSFFVAPSIELVEALEAGLASQEALAA
jgi:chemotaxis signal transduction protein/chemotaxis protein CheY-P-specific phosphatase CheC